MNHKFTNKLEKEKSPYLLQHAHNPVNWYPWSKEAFEKAEKEDKPIFLSIGYSTCHWCHVMEHESFEDESIAKVMNEHYVNIKVDREERPDVDNVYMTFVQALTGGGGWPLSIWLTPSLKPFYGGTYFPPTSKYGRPSFPQILLHFSKLWKQEKKELLSESERILEVLKRETESKDFTMKHQEILNKGVNHYINSFDPEEGGYGGAPKFPRPVIFNFLFRVFDKMRSNPQLRKEILDGCLFTLEKMSYGGMYDHLAGGFHRYSVDEEWHVPHFEKMIYDQSQLIISYCDAYQITKKEHFANVAKETLRYSLEEMRYNGSAFYSAEDADSLPNEDSSRKLEGAFYVWSYEEIEKIIGDKVFNYLFDVREGGNVKPESDPHKELLKKNVLIQRHTLEEACKKFNIELSKLKKDLGEWKEKLYKERAKRPRPHLDDKILTSWNGLMISALAKSGQVLDKKYITEGFKTVQFIKENLYVNGILMRSYRNGISPIEGFLTDYAFLIRGLLDLYDTSGDISLIEWAEELQKKQLELFFDSKNGGFYIANGNDKTILIRQKDDYDGAEPSGNSVTIMNLLRLYHLTNNESFESAAEKSLNYYATTLERATAALPEMLNGLDEFNESGKMIVIIYKSKDMFDESISPFLKEIHSRFLPKRTIVYWNKGNEEVDKFWSKRIDYLKDAKMIDDKPTVYLCQNFSCQLPTNNVEEFKKEIEK